MQHVDGAVDGASRGERAEVVAFFRARAPVLGQLRRGVVARQDDERERFVVAQNHVVARAEPLDQIGFEQQRLGVGADRHELHAGRGRDHPRDAVGVIAGADIVGNARFQRPRLADVDHLARAIEHAVDARRGRQIADVAGDDIRPGLRGRRSGGRRIEVVERVGDVSCIGGIWRVGHGRTIGMTARKVKGSGCGGDQALRPVEAHDQPQGIIGTSTLT